MMPFEPIEHDIDINGLRLNYVDWGNPGYQPLLLLHGFTGHARVWDEFALTHRNHFHIIALSQRGHGNSQWSETVSYSMDDHFTDIATFISALDLNNIILMGHSMGGRNALFYTACVPERISRLILVDARPGNTVSAARALSRHITCLPDNVESLDEVVSAMRELYPYLPPETCNYMASHGFKQNGDKTLSPKYDMKMGKLSERAGCVADDLWPFLDNISCPTMIVRGMESPFISREDALKMSAAIPNAVMMEIPDSSHMPVQENPDGFKKAFSEFLGICS